MGEKEKAILIYYHKSDFDGYISQMILANDFIKHDINVKCIPYNHNIPINIEAFEKLSEDDRKQMTLIFADVLPINKDGYMQKLLDLFGNNIIIIDHHISTINYLNTNFPNKFNALISTNYAACELAWMFLLEPTIVHNAEIMQEHTESRLRELYQSVPPAVKYFGRYDIHDMSGTEFSWETIEVFQSAMRALNINFNICEDNMTTINNPDYALLKRIVFEPIEFIKALCGDISLIDMGKSIIKYNFTRNNKLCIMRDKIRARLYSPIGRKFTFSTVYFAQDFLNNSKIFEDAGIFNDPNAVYILASYNILNGKYNVSLYSTEDSKHDVSKAAEFMGGGGHEHCAGFICSFINYNSNPNNEINVLTIK